MFSSKFPLFGQTRLPGFFASPDTQDVQLRVTRFRPKSEEADELNTAQKAPKAGSQDVISRTARI